MITKAAKDVGEGELPPSLLVDCKLVELLCKLLWNILKKLKINRTQDTDILLGICLRNSTSYSTDTCSATVIATLFIIARKWKNSKCPSTDEWIMNCSTYTL